MLISETIESNRSKRRLFLYHGTSIESLAGILRDGFVMDSPPDDYDDNNFNGVSLTTSLGIAKKFAEETQDRYDVQSPFNDEVVLVFDANAIKKSIGGEKVAWDGNTSEHEYRTYGCIYNPLQYLFEIRLYQKAIDWWIKTFQEENEFEMAKALKMIPVSLFKPYGVRSSPMQKKEPIAITPYVRPPEYRLPGSSQSYIEEWLMCDFVDERLPKFMHLLNTKDYTASRKRFQAVIQQYRVN